MKDKIKKLILDELIYQWFDDESEHELIGLFFITGPTPWSDSGGVASSGTLCTIMSEADIPAEDDWEFFANGDTEALKENGYELQGPLIELLEDDLPWRCISEALSESRYPWPNRAIFLNKNGEIIKRGSIEVLW